MDLAIRIESVWFFKSGHPLFGPASGGNGLLEFGRFNTQNSI